MLNKLLTNFSVSRSFALPWLYMGILLWHHLSVGCISLNSAVWLFSLLAISLLAGDLILNFLFKDNQKCQNLITKLLLGFLFLNTAMFFLSLLLPFGLIVDWYLLVFGVLFLWINIRWSKKSYLFFTPSTPETIFFLIAPIAVTTWSQDILRPIAIVGDTAVIRSWQDIFYHLSQISIYASSHGISTIGDPQGANLPTHIYHVASYLIPATLVSVAGISSLETYSSFYVPFGLFITALAAYSLINVAFNKWAALCSSLSILLLPDAVQQGFGNPFFGYHWLQQIAPSGLYGVAVASSAFMFLYEGCRTKNFRLLFFGYLFICLTVFYKAQIFVTVSFPALIFIPLFFPGIPVKNRLLILAIFSGIYFFAIALSQHYQSIPLIRLDGSSLSSYMALIFSRQADGSIKNIIQPFFNMHELNWTIKAFGFCILLSIWTFGLYLFAYCANLRYLERNFNPSIWSFPLIVVLVYLVMATCLAWDDRQLGTPEELLHRPFVWAYFIVLTWCCAVLYVRFFGDGPPRNYIIKISFTFLIFIFLISTIYFGKEIQTFKTWGVGYQEIPQCQVKVADFIKQHSGHEEIIQDSSNDPKFILSALSERRVFAVDVGGIRLPEGVRARLNLLGEIKGVNEILKIELFMRMNSIKWYVVSTLKPVQWAQNAEAYKVFECKEYVVFRFP